MSDEQESLIIILHRIAERMGWRVTPDRKKVSIIAKGLLKNEQKYGARICPCRIPFGNPVKDQDIVCPCVYAADDIANRGKCFCGLFLKRGK